MAGRAFKHPLLQPPPPPPPHHAWLPWPPHPLLSPFAVFVLPSPPSRERRRGAVGRHGTASPPPSTSTLSFCEGGPMAGDSRIYFSASSLPRNGPGTKKKPLSFLLLRHPPFLLLKTTLRCGNFGRKDEMVGWDRGGRSFDVKLEIQPRTATNNVICLNPLAFKYDSIRVTNQNDFNQDFCSIF